MISTGDSGGPDLKTKIKDRYPPVFRCILNEIVRRLCYRILLDMIDNGVWQEPVTGVLATEFNDIIICGYANPRKKVLTTFTDHLQTVARNYTQAETANLNR